MAGGLLDFLETPEGQGLLAATFGGLAGAQRGTPVNNIGRAGLAGLSGYGGAQDRIAQSKIDAEKQKYVQSQMEENASQVEQRNAAMAKQAETQKLLKNIFGGGSEPATSPGAFSASADGMGPTMPQTMQPKGGGLSSMTIDQVGALKAMGGPDLLDAYKFAKDPMQLQQGSTYVDRVTGKSTFVPKVSEGIAPNAQGVYGELPNYGNAQAGIEAAKAGAIERSKAGFDLREVRGPDGAMRAISKLEILKQNSASNTGALPENATSPGAFAMANPGAKLLASRPGESDAPQIYVQALGEANTRLASAKAPADVARAQADVSAITSEMRKLKMPTGVQNSQASQPFTTTASDTQIRSNEVGSKLNDSWIKNTYEPLIASLGAVGDTLDSVRIARSSIDKMGGTGWGTETKAQAANILAGLGVSPGNSKMFATNTQAFQNAAMGRLQVGLAAQKGPQTEGDAQRQAKTFASLSNTTEANNFILDTIEAKAARDKLKADFYQQGLPIAQKKGDLQELDREWAKRAPSIFNMPSMKRWGVK
jgi:hypothetical protein